VESTQRASAALAPAPPCTTTASAGKTCPPESAQLQERASHVHWTWLEMLCCTADNGGQRLRHCEQWLFERGVANRQVGLLKTFLVLFLNKQNEKGARGVKNFWLIFETILQWENLNNFGHRKNFLKYNPLFGSSWLLQTLDYLINKLK
jgi:hypothetical protein